MTADEFSSVAELGFDIDLADEDRALTEVIDDETLRLVRRDNRVALARAPARRVAGPDVPPERSAYDVPLLFVVHAHPDCTFVWSRLMVDLTPTPDCVVADMSPRDVEDIAVDVETSVGLGLAFSLASNAVDLGATPELSKKRTVYFPTVLTSGVGFHKAYWDFLPKAGDYLHTDKEVHLLIDAPPDTPVLVDLTVRAKVRFRGLPRLIPLLARTSELETRIRLA
ncbi:MAG TPA: hypothetical protein VHF89_08175 [Solirubrobacteraceae bacterium]|nr:hypothetical protein [Solirubrobacteraceae bacterium]